MPRFIRCVVLAGAMAGLIGVGGGFTAAQPKKDVKAKETKAAEKLGTVEINKDKGGQYRFKVVDTDGKAIVQSSKGYATKDEALKAIDTVKATLNKGKVVEGKE